GKGFPMGGNFRDEFGDLLGPGGEAFVIGRFLEGRDDRRGEVVPEAGEADGVGAVPQGDFGGLVQSGGAFLLAEEAVFQSLGGCERLARGGGLRLEFADGRVLIGELLPVGGGGLPLVEVAFLQAAEFFHLGEFGVGGGFLLTEAWQSGIRLGECDFGALVGGGRMFEAVGGFSGAIESGFGFGELEAGEFGFRTGLGLSGGGEQLVVGGGDAFADALVGG